MSWQSSNAQRNPGRTASTAAALMIGITLVTVVAVLGAGMSKATENAVTDQVRASYVVDGQDGMTFDAEDGDELAQVAGVKAASHVRTDKALVKGEEIDVTGIDAATIDRFYRFEWTAGSLAGLDDDGALVTKDYADDHGLAVGERLALQTPSGEKLALVVRGVYDPPQARQMLQEHQHRPGDVRPLVPDPEERVHVPRGRRARPTPGSRPRSRTPATLCCTRATRMRRTPRRTWRPSSRCSTCCSASR